VARFATQDVKLVDSADNSTFADVPGAAFATQTDVSSAPQLISSTTQAVRRYVAATLTLAGGTPSFTSTVVVAKL
jgi:hypothetical protein